MNVGSNKWPSRFREILNTVMEKMHSAKAECLRLLLFRDSWHFGSFSPKGVNLCVFQSGNFITAFACLLT